jgi:hypothetical protein
MSKPKKRETGFIPLHPWGHLMVCVIKEKGNPAFHPGKESDHNPPTFKLQVSLSVKHDHFLPEFPVREMLEEPFTGSIYSLREKVGEWLKTQLGEDGLTQHALDVGSSLLTRLVSK